MNITRGFSILLLAIGLSAISAARAEPFTLLIYETQSDIAARADQTKSHAYWAGYNAFAKALMDAGVMRGGTALPGAAGGMSVGSGNGGPEAPAVQAEGKALQLGGYFVIEAPNLDAAVAWAKRAPGLSTGRVEVLPHVCNPTMPGK